MFLMRTELACRAAELAEVLLGQPNRQLSSKRELRFGRKGSLVVAIAGPKAGNWFDHENDIGGDLLDLIRRQNGGGFADAIEYAQRFNEHAVKEKKNSDVLTRRRRDTTDTSLTYQRRALELWNGGGRRPKNRPSSRFRLWARHASTDLVCIEWPHRMGPHLAQAV
jgi:putative DNA primase/helicase